MIPDKELSQLEYAAEFATDLRQRAYEAKQTSWARMVQCRDDLKRYYVERSATERRYKELNEQDKAIRIQNSPLITAIAAERDSEFARMGNKNAALKYYTRMGNHKKIAQSIEERYLHECQAKAIANERQGLIAEIVFISDERKRARSDLRAVRTRIFIKENLIVKLQSEFQRLDAQFIRASEQALATYDLCKARRNELAAQRRQRRSENNQLAKRAGVPLRFRKAIHVVVDVNGDRNIYFGGKGRPDGENHGHFVIDRHGRPTYRRLPGQPHGPHNFVANQRVRVSG